MNDDGDQKAPAEGRVARRQRRNRDALIAAARDIMTDKGVEAATMLEIADRADVGAGTVYNYFKSKDELAIAVLETLMHDLALRIQAVTDRFEELTKLSTLDRIKVASHVGYNVFATSSAFWEQRIYSMNSGNARRAMTT